MSQSVPSTTASAAYGNYILRTGRGIVAEVELAYGQHWYSTRFAGRKPVLDLGPGRCWFTRQNPVDVVAVDNSPQLVDHYRNEGLDIRLGDAYDIPFPNDHFEGVFCCWLFEHLAEPARALIEIRRVTKPGGYVCLVVPSPHDIVAFYDDYTHVRPFTRVSLNHLAEDTGFQRHLVDFLPWVRGLSFILRYGGPKAASVYFKFSETTASKFGLLNRNNLMLQLWK
jgi:SAM-dependent methyltransferase